MSSNSRQKENVDRFKTAKMSSELHPELMASMTPKSYSFHILTSSLNLQSAGSMFCKLGIQVILSHISSMELVRSAHRTFDQATQLAMHSPFVEEKKGVEVN